MRFAPKPHTVLPTLSGPCVAVTKTVLRKTHSYLCEAQCGHGTMVHHSPDPKSTEGHFAIGLEIDFLLKFTSEKSKATKKHLTGETVITGITV